MGLSTDPEWLSPLWLEKKLNAILAAAHKQVQSLFRHPWFAAAALLGVSVLSLATAWFFQSSQVIPDLGHFNFAPRRLPVILAMFSLASLMPKRVWVYTSTYRAISIGAISAFVAFALFSGQSNGIIFCEVLMVAALTSFSVIGTRHLKYGPRLIVQLLCFLFAFFWPSLVTWWTGRGFIPEIYFFPSAYLVLLSIVLVRAQAAGRLTGMDNWSLATHAFSPVLMVEPMPLPPHMFPENQTQEGAERAAQERTDSVTSLLAGWLWLAVALAVHQLFLRGQQSPGPIFNLRLGWFIYIYYYFAWMGLLRIGYATARNFGYRIEAPCEQALLAANPRERWRRWNIYLYNFMFQQVFFPTYKKIRSVGFAVAAVFALDFFLHNVGGINTLVTHHHLGHGFLSFMRGEVLFYALHSLSLMVGIWFDRWWPPAASRRAWWGVLITHGLMALTHSVVQRL